MSPLQLIASVGHGLRLLAPFGLLACLVALGVWTLIAAPAVRWYDPLLRTGGAAAFATAGAAAGWFGSQRRCVRSLRRQLTAWEEIVDVLLQWMEGLNPPLTAVKDLEDVIAKLLIEQRP